MENKFDGLRKNLDILPSEPGEYAILVEGVDFFDTPYLNFDGKQWTNLDGYSDIVKNDLSRITYYNEEPFKSKQLDLPTPSKMPWKI